MGEENVSVLSNTLLSYTMLTSVGCFRGRELCWPTQKGHTSGGAPSYLYKLKDIVLYVWVGAGKLTLRRYF